MSISRDSFQLQRAAAGSLLISQPPAGPVNSGAVTLAEPPALRRRLAEAHPALSGNPPVLIVPGRVDVAGNPPPRRLGEAPPFVQGDVTDRSRAEVAELSGHFAESSMNRAHLQSGAVLKNPTKATADIHKGGRGGATLALTNELAGLKLLRKSKKPITVPPPPDRIQADSPAALGVAGGARDSASVANRAVSPPQDSTEDHVELKLIKAEALAVLAEISADAIVTTSENPVGVLPLSAETGASLIGLVPEACVVILRAIEYRSGKRLEAQAQAPLDVLSEIEAKLEQRSQDLQAAGNGVVVGVSAAARQNELKQINSLREQIGRLKAGYEVSRARGEQIREHAKHELIGPSVAMVGGTARVAGTAMLAVAEHAGAHTLAAAGASTAAVAGVLALPFSYMLMRENLTQANADQNNLLNAQYNLDRTARRQDVSQSDEVSGLQRGLAKMAQARSSPNESRFKALLFGVGVGSGVLGIASSALLLAQALGAAVAAAVSTVTLIGSGVGIAMGVLFVGYLVYKRLTRDTTYSNKELAGVLNDPDSRLGLELQHRQTVKLDNRLLGEVMRSAILSDPDVQNAMRAMARGDTPDPPLVSTIEAVLGRVGLEPGDRQIDEGSFSAHAREVAAAIDRWLGGPISIKAGFEITRPEGSIEDYAMSKLAGGVSQAIDDKIRTLNSLHTPLLSSARLQSALELGLRADSPVRNDLIAIFKAELPLTDARIDEVIARADQVVPNVDERPLWAREVETEAERRDAVSLGGDLRLKAGERKKLLEDLVKEAAPEMARLAAMRKLLRRDKEALLYAIIGTLKRLQDEVKVLTADGASEEQLARAASLSSQVSRLKFDLLTFGVKEETLKIALGANSVEQMVQATALLAKELSFE